MPPRLLHFSDLENAYDEPARIARVAGLLADRRDDDALVAGSGDNTAPGVLSLVSDGRQALDFFDVVRPDAETVGNHDFDSGTDALRDLIGDAPQQWVLANVTQGGDVFGADVGVRDAAVIPVGDASVGVTGVLDRRTPSMVPGLDGPDFGEPVAAAVRVADALRDSGADYVVVLAHVSDEEAERIAREADADAVLAGHAHDPRDDAFDGTILTRTGATGTYVYEVDLGSGAVTRHETADARPDPDVQRALQERISAHGLDEVVASVETPLQRDRDTRVDGEWRLGNFVADAYRWAADADVALQNAGGIREGPALSGDVTVAELVGLSPFDEAVAVASVSGAELEQIAREADGRRVEDLPDYWWGHVSGMRIARNGSGLDVRVDGEPVDRDETYHLATSDYLLTSDLEFPTLTESHRVEKLSVQHEIIVEYAREHGVGADLEGRVPGGDA